MRPAHPSRRNGSIQTQHAWAVPAFASEEVASVRMQTAPGFKLSKPLSPKPGACPNTRITAE